MFKIAIVTTIACSVALCTSVQETDACGMKRTSGSRNIRKKTSKNPSKILVVGQKDSALLRSLQVARHNVDYATSISSAKKKRYRLVITDRDQLADAQTKFSSSMILLRKGSKTLTLRTTEVMLARTKKSTSKARTVVAAKEAQIPVKTGLERPSLSSSSKTRKVTRRIPSRSDKSTPLPPLIEKKVETVEYSKPKTKTKTKTTESSKQQPKIVKKSLLTDKPKKKVIAKIDNSVSNNRWNKEIQFALNSSIIAPSIVRRLKQNSNWLLANPNVLITIEGHTDSSGDAEKNLELSERRAETAKQLLVNWGIDSSRISVVPKGETEPSYPPRSPRNRRIVLVKDMQ